MWLRIWTNLSIAIAEQGATGTADKNLSAPEPGRRQSDSARPKSRDNAAYLTFTRVLVNGKTMSTG